MNRRNFIQLLSVLPFINVKQNKEVNMNKRHFIKSLFGCSKDDTIAIKTEWHTSSEHKKYREPYRVLHFDTITDYTKAMKLVIGQTYNLKLTDKTNHTTRYNNVLILGMRAWGAGKGEGERFDSPLREPVAMIKGIIKEKNNA